MNRLPFDPYDFFGYLASGLVVILGMNVVLGFPQVLGADLRPVETLFLLLAVYVTGQITASPAKALLEDAIVGRVLGRPAMNLLAIRPSPFWSRLFPGYYHAWADRARDRLLARCAAEGVDAADAGEPIFLHVRFRPEIRTDTSLMKRLDEFRNKYGFCRNLSFVTLIVGIVMVTRYWFEPRPELLQYGVTALAAGIMLFYRYLKFLRLYTFELFNTYAHAALAEAVR